MAIFMRIVKAVRAGQDPVRASLVPLALGMGYR